MARPSGVHAGARSVAGYMREPRHRTRGQLLDPDVRAKIGEQRERDAPSVRRQCEAPAPSPRPHRCSAPRIHLPRGIHRLDVPAPVHPHDGGIRRRARRELRPSQQVDTRSPRSRSRTPAPGSRRESGTGGPVAASAALSQGTAMSVPELVRYSTCPVGTYQAPMASSKSARTVSRRASYTYTRLGRQLTGPTH